MDRLEHAGTGEERAEDGQAEGGDDQGEIPDPEQTPPLLDHHRMEVGGTDQPRQQGGVLHRVPGPEPTPAQDLIRPPRAHQDADGEEGPREQGPSPGLALPVLVEATGDQRGDGEREREGEPDHAQVEQRRVDGVERIVLEQHVGPEPRLRDGPDDVAERVGRPEHQGEEESGHHIDHQGRPGHQGLGRPTPEAPHHGGGVAGEDHRPQQNRPGQRRPQPGDRVEEGRIGGVVVGHEGQREVVGDERVLHGPDGDDAPEEDQRRVELATAHGGGPAPGQSGRYHRDAHQRSHQPQQYAGVAERAVHR